MRSLHPALTQVDAASQDHLEDQCALTRYGHFQVLWRASGISASLLFLKPLVYVLNQKRRREGKEWCRLFDIYIVLSEGKDTVLKKSFPASQLSCFWQG